MQSIVIPVSSSDDEGGDGAGEADLEGDMISSQSYFQFLATDDISFGPVRVVFPIVCWSAAGGIVLNIERVT